ncbi:MAG TPA: AsmA family protein, partial [Chitinophagaceae bacterium]|nr:AsmA family protein [Chitinophagaceae bacterium]
MSYSPPAHNYGQRIYKRILRIILWVLGILFILIIIIILLVQTPYVQNIARTKAEQYLSRKLRTRVEIKELSISFPSHVSLGGIYIEDRQKDTLLAGKKLELGLNMWKLLHNEVAIGKVELSGITCKIKRELPDTSFNFQFIIDAFAPAGPPKPKAPSDTAQMLVTLQSLQLDSIRVIYKDVVTGNDLEAWIGHTAVSMKEFNTVAQRFAVASLQVKDTRARFYRTRPLLPAAPDAVSPPPARTPYFALQTFLLDQVLLDYRDSVGSFYTNMALGKLAGELKSMDLDRHLIEVKSITLDQTSASVLLGKKASVPVIKKASPATPGSGLPTPDSTQGWRIIAASVQLNDDAIRYDDDNQRRMASGMDYAHIKTTGLTLHAANLLYSSDTISAHITEGSMKEKSGFELSRLQTRFFYSARQAYLEDLDLRTPHTILRDFVRI